MTSEYLQVEWVGGLADIPVVPRPLAPKGKRWTAAGALASEVVREFPPSSSYPLVREGGALTGDIVLDYRDDALDALWAAVKSEVRREWLQSVKLAYYVIKDRELRLRYERFYGDEHYQLPGEILSRLGRLHPDETHDDGVFFAYAIAFDREKLPADLFATDHQSLAQRSPVPLCPVNDVPTERGGGTNHAPYHLRFDMPDGEMIVEVDFRSDDRGFFPAIVCGKNFKEVEASDERRCPKCQALIGTYPELMS